MVSSGMAVWLCWSGQLSTSVSKAFIEYGGMKIQEESNQAVWFFFGEEVFRALAKLQVWSGFNPLPVFLEVFPASFLVGFSNDVALSVSAELSDQTAISGNNLEIFIHPKFENQLKDVTGITVIEAKLQTGLSSVFWKNIEVDPNLTYEANMGWHFVIRPLGDPLDKNTAEGWRAIFVRLRALLERYSINSTFHEGFLLFTLTSPTQFRFWCKEILLFSENMKRDDSGAGYWPCVMAAIPSKGIPFNRDLPKKFSLDWKNLTPDFPHMSYKSAYILGNEFKIQEIRHTYNQTGRIDDWCNVALAPKVEEEADEGKVDVNLPRSLLTGKYGTCFYCGLNNHEPIHCPSKLINGFSLDGWEPVNQYDFRQMHDIFEGLDKELLEEPLEKIRTYLQAKDPKGAEVLIRGVFEVSAWFQLRTLKLIWMSVGRDLPQGITQIGDQEGDLIWSGLDCLVHQDRLQAERLSVQAVTKAPYSFQARCLQGFAAMEALDWDQAVYYWQEAQRLGRNSLQIGYNLFLQGRAFEIQGEYQKAISIYKKAKEECIKWLEPEYRQGVCMVKLGFTDHGLGTIIGLTREDPVFFHRILFDPELERGRVHILTSIWQNWINLSSEGAMCDRGLKKFASELETWFEKDSPAYKQCYERIAYLSSCAQIGNYVMQTRLIKGFDGLRQMFKDIVEKQVKNMQNKIKEYHETLKSIHMEAAWFPFPKFLREFNRDFNFCAQRLNWMSAANIEVAENFRKGQEFLAAIEKTIKTLRGRLLSLRLVRDVTLFALMFGRTFLWLEIIGIALTFALGLLAPYLAEQMGMNWLADLLTKQQMGSLQKGLVILVSILALAIAAIRTAARFEKKKQQLFEESDKQAKRMLAQREKIRAKKAEELATLQKMRGTPHEPKR